jgi:hypothetical protein
VAAAGRDGGRDVVSRWPLLLLAAYLLGWRPITFAVELASTLPSLGLRGPLAALELLFHAAAAALAVAGGRSAWSGGLTLARAAVVVSAVVSVQSLYWSVLPSQTVPGDELPLAAVAVAHAGAWLLYLKRLG